MVGATRARRLGEQADGVGCYVRSANGIDGFASCGPGTPVRHLTGHEALAFFRADPHEPGRPLRDDHDSLVATLVCENLTSAVGAAGRLRGVRKRVWTRLGETLQHAQTDDEAQFALEALYQHPLTGLAETRLRRAVRNGISDIDLFALLRKLHSDGSLVIPTKTGEDPVRIITTMGVTP
jgi:hypothetical protein